MPDTLYLLSNNSFVNQHGDTLSFDSLPADIREMINQTLASKSYKDSDKLNPGSPVPLIIFFVIAAFALYKIIRTTIEVKPGSKDDPNTTPEPVSKDYY